ncbi:MAG: hypothetical protein VR69_10110 [Peptococcaceae bacterium BRH_c4b]|nr:MAG: hypothetical protein VR69_10110 [Peptococcaceae bacterium BRH_c4b]
MTNKTIPNFGTFQEARDFWNNNSLADFENDLEETKEVKFTRKKLIISIDLEKEDEKRLRLIAKQKGVKYSDLIASWVKERLNND